MDLVTTLCGRSPFVVGILATTGEIKDACLPKSTVNPPRPSNKTLGRVWQPLSRRVKPKPKPQPVQRNQKVIATKPVDQEKVRNWESVVAEDSPQTDSVVRKGQWRAIRVFISSTFVDTHGERDMLIRHVFPEVNKLLRSHYVRVIPIDLRWGVNDTHHIQATCLDYIDQCRVNGGLPWFISLRTQRYGWVQTDYQKPQDFAHPGNLMWLKDFDLNSIPLSITNMEVMHAFLGREQRAPVVDSSKCPHVDNGSESGSESEDEGSETDESDGGSSECSRSSYSSEHSGGSSERSRSTEREQSPSPQQQQHQIATVPHSFFLFRNENFMDAVPRDRQWIFDFEYRVPKDPSVSASMRDQYTFDPQAEFYRNQFKAMNQSIRASSLPKVVYDYSCNYESSTVSRAANGKGLQGVGHVTQLDAFRAFLVQQLCNSVMAEYPSQGMLDRRTTENAAHFAVIEERAASFVGREDVLADIHNHCLDESRTAFVLTGEAGAGKSACLAKFCLSLQHQQDVILLPHVVGATTSSTDLHQLLTRICTELKILCPKELSDCSIPGTDFTKLSVEWASVFLAKAAASKRVIIVVDDLDGLTEHNGAHSLAWLPKELPMNVKLVLSCEKDGVCMENLVSVQEEAKVRELENLSTDERSQLVSAYLATYNKSLHTEQGQMTTLLSKTQASLPLYLVIASDALRRFGVYEKLNEYLVDLPKTVPGLLRHIIQELENVHGPIVRMALSLIACSKSGLLESDLVALLDSLNLSSSSTWGTLFEAMRGFLSGGDSGFVRFFHNELKRVIEDRYNLGPRYATEEKHHQIHLILANYFLSVCEKEVTTPSSQTNAEQAFDVIYHLLEADQPKRVRTLLLRMDWIYARVRYGGPVAGLLQDVEMYLKFVPRDKAIATLGIGIVLACPALSVDWRQLAVQLQARLVHMVDHHEELATLLNPASWTSSQHPANPCFLSVSKPGGPEITRINRARLPLNTAGEATFQTKYCFSYYPNGRIGVINIEGGFKACELSGHSKEVYGLSTFGHEDDAFGALSWGNDHKVIVWDLQAALRGRRDVAKRYQTTVDEHVMGCAMVYGESIVVIWTAHKVFVWTLGRNLVEVAAHTDRLVGGYILPGAERKASLACKLVTFGRDKNLVLYDIVAISSLKGAPVAGVHYFVLSGHEDWVLGASLVQKSVLSWSRDGSLRLWDTKDHAQEILSHKHASAVVNHHIFNEQKEMFTWDSTTELFYWDLLTKQGIALKGHAAQVEGVVVLPGNEWAISYGRDRSLNLWDLKEVRERLEDGATVSHYPMKGHSDWVLGVLVLHEGKHALSWSRDKKLLFWDLATVQKQAGVQADSPPSMYKKPKKPAAAAPVVAAPRGRGRKSKKKNVRQRVPIRVGPPMDVRPFVKLKGHTDWVRGAMVFRNESFVLSFGGSELMIWSLENVVRVLNESLSTPGNSKVGRQQQKRLGRSIFVPVPLLGHPTRVQSAVVAVASDSTYHALSISKDKTLIEWNLDIAQEEGRAREPMLKKALADEAIDLRKKAKQLQKEYKLKRASGEATEEKKKEKGKQGEDGEEEVAKPCLFSNSLGHTKWITGAKFFKANTRAITWGKDSNIVLWDMQKQASSPSDRHMLTLTGHTDFVRGLMFLDKGNKIISWSKDNNIIVWSINSESFSLVKLQGHSDIILGCRLLDHEQKALSFSRDKSIRLWDLTNLSSTPVPIVCLGEKEENAHSMWIRGVAVVNIDGHEKFLSWADDGKLKLWDAQRARAGVEILDMTLEGHEAKVLGCMALSEVQTQTGKRNRDFTSHALSFSADNAMILWDLKASLLQNRSVCMQLQGHNDWVIGAKLVRVPTTHGSRLLNRLLSWSRDGSMRLWDLGNLNEDLPSSTQSVCEFECEVGILASVVVSRDCSSILCVGANSNDILVWDLKAIVSSQEPWVGRRSRFTSVLQGHTLPPTRLSLFAEDTRLLSVDKQTLTVWDLGNSVSLWTLTFDTPISTCASAFGIEERGIVEAIDAVESEDGDSDAVPSDAKQIPGLSQLFVGHTDGTVSHVLIRP